MAATTPTTGTKIATTPSMVLPLRNVMRANAATTTRAATVPIIAGVATDQPFYLSVN
jgi:hypothetical protein